MKPIRIVTNIKRMMADVYTPVGIYLRLRDRFRDTILLESADHHAAENSYSFIGINAIAGIEITDRNYLELKMPGAPPERTELKGNEDLEQLIWNFMSRFEVHQDETASRFAQGMYGYFSFEAVQFFETIKFPQRKEEKTKIPIARYRLYQYVIAINHYRDELLLLENCIDGMPGDPGLVESLIRSRDVPSYPFRPRGSESSNMQDDDFISMVEKGKAACRRGDVFQIVLSRRFEQAFHGDEFNVYRALRHINPSPYLFYFDYGDYRLMGSSPEAQLLVSNGRAVVHPIAGTFRRTGNDAEDSKRAEELLRDPKENAEHVMLVDLARNDLSTVCRDVSVTRYRQVQYYSHVIHLVSEVSGSVEPGFNPFRLLFKTFPAGTLSGAPKYRAMELINEWEPSGRSFYGGAIGFTGFDGSTNHAIMIRSMLSRDNTLYLQAGAGIVAASDAHNELQEVSNKLEALKKAIEMSDE